MRKPVIAGNWKMNLTISQAVEFVLSIQDGLNAIQDVERVIAPPFIALAPLANILESSPIQLAAQNMYFKESGAFTGEISPGMLQDICKYVIIGHSERRTHFGETDELLNQKVHAALSHSLAPIFCVGENLEQKEANSTDSYISGQIQRGLANIEVRDPQEIVVAYEPIWAIGTGKACDPDAAQHVIGSVIRHQLAVQFGQAIADSIRVLYGGSVKAENVKDFMQQPDIDGALVGGASLKESWVELTQKAAQWASQ